MGHYREPIKHTCPDIDKLIYKLSTIRKITRGYERIEESSLLIDIISDIEHELYDFDAELERLRKSNDTLRDWGISEACNYDELENKYSELENNLHNEQD